MGRHFFGTKVGDQRARFFKEFTDAEFDKLVYGHLGGTLPKGVWAWHLAEHETIHNSRRAQAIAKLPVVCDWIGAWSDPQGALIKMADEEKLVGIRQ